MNAGLFLLTIAALFVLYQLGLRSIRCQYCGRVNEHEPHCPYFNSGLTGGKQ